MWLLRNIRGENQEAKTKKPRRGPAGLRCALRRLAQRAQCSKALRLGFRRARLCESWNSRARTLAKSPARVKPGRPAGANTRLVTEKRFASVYKEGAGFALHRLASILRGLSMQRRRSSSAWLVPALVAALGRLQRRGRAGAAVPARATTAPRTPWGDPDLKGMWPIDKLNGTPVQRPESFGDRRLPHRRRVRGARRAAARLERALRRGNRYQQNGHRPLGRDGRADRRRGPSRADAAVEGRVSAEPRRRLPHVRVRLPRGQLSHSQFHRDVAIRAAHTTQ